MSAEAHDSPHCRKITLTSVPVLHCSYNDEGIWAWNKHGSDWIYQVRSRPAFFLLSPPRFVTAPTLFFHPHLLSGCCDSRVAPTRLMSSTTPSTTSGMASMIRPHPGPLLRYAYDFDCFELKSKIISLLLGCIFFCKYSCMQLYDLNSALLQRDVVCKYLDSCICPCLSDLQCNQIGQIIARIRGIPMFPSACL